MHKVTASFASAVSSQDGVAPMPRNAHPFKITMT